VKAVAVINTPRGSYVFESVESAVPPGGIGNLSITIPAAYAIGSSIAKIVASSLDLAPVFFLSLNINNPVSILLPHLFLKRSSYTCFMRSLAKISLISCSSSPSAQLSSKPRLINIIVTLTPISVCNFGQTFRAFERRSWIMPGLNAYNIYLWL